jgi:hypothetical protein
MGNNAEDNKAQASDDPSNPTLQKDVSDAAAAESSRSGFNRGDTPVKQGGGPESDGFNRG